MGISVYAVVIIQVIAILLIRTMQQSVEDLTCERNKLRNRYGYEPSLLTIEINSLIKNIKLGKKFSYIISVLIILFGLLYELSK